jgi:hypothetical protein
MPPTADHHPKPSETVDEVGFGSVAGGATTREPPTQLVFDLNDEVVVSALIVVTMSLGEASLVFPPPLFISTRWDGVLIRSSCSTPNTTPRTSAKTRIRASSQYFGLVPNYLASIIHKWLRERRSLQSNASFAIPQAKKLIIIQKARKINGLDFSTHQKTLIL